MASGQSAESYLSRLTSVLSALDTQSMDRAVELIYSAWMRGKQVITLGNGGSAITALHFITDWNKAPYLSSGIPFRGRTLIDNVGLAMAYSNDIGFDEVFVEQLKNIAAAGDLIIAISGSGNSENVVRAITYANRIGCQTLGLCGFSGGRLKEVAQHVVWARVDDMQLCEDAHAIFGHVVVQALCAAEKKREMSATLSNKVSDSKMSAFRNQTDEPSELCERNQITSASP